MNEPFNLHKMGLNELKFIDKELAVRRVPGGWIYEYYAGGLNYQGGVFVPLNDEFKTAKIAFDRAVPCCS